VIDNYGGLKPYDYYSKVFSLLVLSTFHGREEYNKILDYLRKVIVLFDRHYGDDWFPRKRVNVALKELLGSELFSSKSDTPLLPSWEWSIEFWTGFECL
jgi:hypothetical protein